MPLLDDAAYPPLNVPKPVADGVWIVDATPIRAQGLIVLPIRMTILRLGDGGLLLYSPTPFRDSLRTAIERLGPIRHIVAPSVGHWMFASDWMRACPEAESWTLREVARRRPVIRAGLVFDNLLDDGPLPWRDAVETIVVRAAGYAEAVMVHTASGTLCAVDLVTQLDPARMPPVSRALAAAAGLGGATGRAPVHLRAVLLLDRDRNAAAARRMIALEPRTLVPAHGDIVDRDATAHLRRSLDWLEPGRAATVALPVATLGVVSALAVAAARRRRRRLDNPPRSTRRKRRSR